MPPWAYYNRRKKQLSTEKGITSMCVGCLEGAMVSVLATGPKVCELKPDWGDEFLRAIKVGSMPSFWGEVKPSAPCKILRNFKPYEILTKIHPKAKLIFSFISFSCFPIRLLCWYDCQRALVHEWGDFSCRYHSAMIIYAHISTGG
jgi:hypothetical protein